MMNGSKPCGPSGDFRAPSPKRKRLRLRAFCSPSPPPSPQGEGECRHRAEKFGRCDCSLRFFVCVWEAHDNQARSSYQSTGECFSLSLRERAGVRGKEANSNPKRTTIPGMVNLRQSPAEPEVSQFALLYSTRSQIELMDRGGDGSSPLPEPARDGPSPPRLTRSRIVQSLTALMELSRIIKLSLWIAMLAGFAISARGVPPTAGQRLWDFDTGKFVRSSPAVGADGSVYFGSSVDC